MDAVSILEYLNMLANNNLAVNLVIHFIVLTGLISIFIIKREWLKRALFQATICVLFLSVTIHALMFGNPFHAFTFGLLGIVALVRLALNKEEVVRTSSIVQTFVALLFIFSGLWYPEFVDRNIASMLLYSPVGIIPCPTLLASIGLMTLVYSGTGRFQYGLTIFLGFVYGVIGTFVLRVYLDVTLLILALYATYVYFTVKPGIIPAVRRVDRI